jgi:hypothetical protein
MTGPPGEGEVGVLVVELELEEALRKRRLRSMNTQSAQTMP